MLDVHDLDLEQVNKNAPVEKSTMYSQAATAFMFAVFASVHQLATRMVSGHLLSYEVLPVSRPTQCALFVVGSAYCTCYVQLYCAISNLDELNMAVAAARSKLDTYPEN